MTRPRAPSRAVLASFGCVGTPRLLGGGQGTSWLAGGLVFKPGADAELQRWLAHDLGALECGGFRLADPIPTLSGTWVCEGWCADRYLSGSEPDRSALSGWRAILGAGRAFHRSTAQLSRPAFLDQRTDRWAIADRMAWGERPLSVAAELAELVRRLGTALTALGASQVIHGDLSGNVLLERTQPPAIIDIAPYWRPSAYAEGILAADAITWHDASAATLAQLDIGRGAVARGLLFRLLSADQHARGAGRALHTDEAARYEAATTMLGL